MSFRNKRVFIIPVEHMTGLSTFAFSVCLKTVLFQNLQLFIGVWTYMFKCMGSIWAESNLFRHMVEMWEES